MINNNHMIRNYILDPPIPYSPKVNTLVPHIHYLISKGESTDVLQKAIDLRDNCPKKS